MNGYWPVHNIADVIRLFELNYSLGAALCAAQNLDSFWQVKYLAPRQPSWQCQCLCGEAQRAGRASPIDHCPDYWLTLLPHPPFPHANAWNRGRGDIQQIVIKIGVK